MDCNDQKNKFDNVLHKYTRRNSIKGVEKKKSLASTCHESCKDVEPKGHDDERLPSEKPTSSMLHKCEFCDKIFSSGKALGGHKRFHLQALKKEGDANINVNIKIKDNGKSSYDDGNKICHVCNKNFSSNKALYGHMRSHPDREWRGIHPNKDNYNIDYYDDHDQYFLSPPKEFVIDDESNSWPPKSFKTDKRGRKDIRSKEVVNASHILMHMSRDRRLHNNLSENLDNEAKDKKVLPSTSGLIGNNIGEIKNNNSKRMKLLVKFKSPCSTSKDNILMEKDSYQHSSYDGDEKNSNKPHDEIKESSQLVPRNILGFDLNDAPNHMGDETN